MAARVFIEQGATTIAAVVEAAAGQQAPTSPGA
jgi:hypothetical protein